MMKSSSSSLSIDMGAAAAADVLEEEYNNNNSVTSSSNNNNHNRRIEESAPSSSSSSLLLLKQQQHSQYHHGAEDQNPTTTTSSGSGSTLPAAMRRLALFVDGMTRALILPFGPSLVHRLVSGSRDGGDPIGRESWSGVAHHLAWVVAAHLLGRWCGTLLSRQAQQPRWCGGGRRLPARVARLGGAAFALHLFTYGAGLASVQWLAAVRFLSAVLAGWLCGLTGAIALPEDGDHHRNHAHCGAAPPRRSSADPLGGSKCNSTPTPTPTPLEEERVDALRRREGYVDIASGTAKMYLTGFAVSILSGGLLFRKATRDSTFRKLTGAYRYSLSPLFLVGAAVATEIVLRGLFFALARRHPHRAREEDGAAGRVRGAVRRMVSDDRVTHHHHRAGREVATSAVESLANSNSGSTSRRRTASTDFTHHPLIVEEGDNDDDDAASDLLSARFFDADNATCATRSRVGSLTSIDEFFDCRSMLSGDGDVEEARAVSPVLIDDAELAQYVHGQCQYADGTPAFVPAGDSAAAVPANYLAFYNGDGARARQAWRVTQRWRREKRVWKIHTLPNAWFPRIKEAYPHFVHGHSRAGHPIVYEQPGRMNLKALFRSGCEIADMVHHYTFFLEYIANLVCTLPEIRRLSPSASEHPSSSTWGTMVVMDVKGAGLSNLSGDVVKYLKQAGDINSAHYPNTMKRAFVVNSPFWLAGAWTGLKGILPDSVQVDILSESKYLDALREFIDDDQIPQEYGGSSPYALGEHPYEVQLHKLVDSVKDIEEETDTYLPASLPPKIEFSAVSHDEDRVNVSATLSPLRTKGVYEPSALRTPPSIHPVRRRVSSVDRESRRKSVEFDPTPSKAVTASFSGQRDVFIIVSVMHVLWSLAQGAIEVAIPLWILSPTIMGGLGYSPSRSGVSLFCACLVLMWTLRTKPSKLVSKIPSNSPLRAFRIGVGSESALLALLACVSTFSSPLKRSDSIVVMTSTILFFSSLALASMVGRSASKILHRIAAEGFARLPKPHIKSVRTRHLLSECEDGRFTSLVNLVAEIAGIFLVAPLWSMSISSERPAPFNGTCILYVCSLITFVLYVCSFSLHLNSVGEFAPHPKDGCTDSRLRRIAHFLCEVIAVSAGDVSSLFEEANWATTPLLGRERIFSESSAVSLFPDVMERGESLPSKSK